MLDKVTLNKKDLIETLKKNRETHAEDYKEAIIGFKEHKKKLLNQMADQADKGKDVDLSPLYHLHKPDNHLKEYDRLISMLTKHLGEQKAGIETVELTAQDFARYHDDDWEWKQGWMTSNSLYSATIAKKMA